MYQGRTQKAKSTRSGVYAETMRTRRHQILSAALGFAGVLLLPSIASADITAFIGVNTTPVARSVRGLSVGTGLVIVAFEFEYASTSEDLLEGAPSLRTFMFNGLLQTPIPVARMQFYGTAGAGAYRETLVEDSETNFGLNVGGGVKVSLVGPLRLRFDYRVFTLKGDARHPRPQRLYAGVNLKF
jgi:opacity protein-like surface antigen